LDLISEGLSSLDSIALDVEPLDSGPVEALDETAGPCLPNPCIDLNQTVCSTGPEGVLCTCDSGFRHSEEGDCVPAPTFDDFNQLVGAYKEAHPGKDGDINQKSTEAVANDPAAQELLAICGPDQRPVIPLLAWEYGGFDHPWEKPEAAALVYCVFTPVSPNSPHWEYEAGSDHVTADLYLPYPAQNPCAASPGSGQVADCIGDYSNFEILVDIASLHDGHDVGLELSEASTELRLIPALGGPPIHLVDDD
jgi:hypothetical protein